MNLLPLSQKPTASATPRPARSAIQMHADYFDLNKDGKISLGEAYSQMRALGVGRVGAALGAVAGNAFLAQSTGSGWRHPFTIITDNIAHGKHPGDTGTFNPDGSFNPAKLNAMFAEHDVNRDGSLDKAEIKSMIAANKKGSALGSILSTVEFGLLMTAAGQPATVDGVATKILTRERIEGFYAGTLLYTLAGQPLPSSLA